MDYPSQEDEPQDGSEYELQDGFEEPSLQQLPQARNEEAAERGEHITSRSLTTHCPSRVERR